jgi:hypothetical protein
MLLTVTARLVRQGILTSLKRLMGSMCWRPSGNVPVRRGPARPGHLSRKRSKTRASHIIPGLVAIPVVTTRTNFRREKPAAGGQSGTADAAPAGDFPRRPADTGQRPFAPRHGGQPKHGFVRRHRRKRGRHRRIATGIEVGLDPGQLQPPVPVQGPLLARRSPRLMRSQRTRAFGGGVCLIVRSPPTKPRSVAQSHAPPVGVGATSNSAISSISAISVQKAQAQTKDRPMQESQNPEQVIKKPAWLRFP